MKRIFIPRVGAKVKLQKWEHYRQLDPVLIGHDQLVQRAYNETSAALRTGDLTEAQAKELEEKIVSELRAQHVEYCKTHDMPTMWAWFEVLVSSEPNAVITPALVKLRHVSRAAGAPDPAWEGWVDITWIQPPLGWEPTYTIFCKSKDEADRVVERWFRRGIHVWVSHDLSSGGRQAFTPFGAGDATEDTPASPHWQFTTEPTESVQPEDCPFIFNVKVLESWEPTLPEGKKEKAGALAALRAEPGVTVTYDKGERFYWATRETVVYAVKGR